MGELMLRGNTVMKGYLKNPSASAEAFAGGWFHTGDLAVMHPDGYVEIKDRAKDIIISGGENISSLEVEEVLYQHPDVMEAAVVARPDEKWGETPQAFVTLKPGATGGDRGRHHRLVPHASGALQVPALRHVRAVAEDVDREDPEVRIAGAGAGIGTLPGMSSTGARPGGATPGRRLRAPFILSASWIGLGATFRTGRLRRFSHRPRLHAHGEPPRMIHVGRGEDVGPRSGIDLLTERL